ncbi:T9SS type B sorting domain-containing protein [Frigoriflavimonas asaccharolytica]|uniref:Gliding motility-associated-like protein n=1 Tax=Frigoriflavimonas asaccharolytica TaxID=2735899 RepID=A0A8J8K985_9FLAO|nr:T9SS type B sorting domain-containing protein [Frigoriflavimonas asaccharolytica]NRS92807.1 gliding motility-associated-like protein [Frigoriflavimonas asaccharolytica]
MNSNIQNQFYVDEQGSVFHTGLASSSGFLNIATPNAYMSTPGQFIKSYLIKFDGNDQKIWGTYYGGNGATQLSNVTKDSSGYIYMSGMSSQNSSGIATPGTFQQTQGSANDGYIVKLQDCDSLGNITSNAPLCTGNTLNLTASGGDSYSWTGPNGFTSNLANPTIPNATVTNNGTYFCLISSNSGCSGTHSITVLIGDNLPPIPNSTTLPDITGNCQTIISTIPTATDNCAGTITATTSNPLSYSQAGNYVITWNFNDGNGNIATQTQNVIITAQNSPVANSPQNFCLINQPKLSDITIAGTNIKWYNAAGILLPANTPLVNGTTYSATQTVNGCESLPTAILANIENPNPPTGNATQTFCPTENATLANLAVTGINIKWYNAAGILLPANTSLANGQTYFATQTINGCESNVKLAIFVVISNDVVPANNYAVSFCNPSVGNSSVINLSNYNGNIIANPTVFTYEYYDATNILIPNFSNVNLVIGINQFKVKVINTNGCFKIVNLTITLLQKPQLNVNNVEFCKGNRAVLDAGSGFATYLWSTGETTQTINVTQSGTYTVTVSNASGCSNTAQIIATETIAGTITGIEIVNNSATIFVAPSGNYLYSIDGINYQNSNVFSNLANGSFTAFIKTNSGCEIKSLDFTIFKIQNVITPNNDGNNDVWNIDGLKNYKNSQVTVFDRFGKIVLDKKDSAEIKWDGTYLGQPLPTNTYWYVLQLSDGRIYKGFLLIKNRE